MAGTRLTFEEAVETWLLRAKGMMRRQIWARYQVDPRRVYEVWSGLDHPESRDAAIQRYQTEFPGKPLEGLFDWHVPTREIRTVSPQLPLF